MGRWRRVVIVEVPQTAIRIAEEDDVTGGQAKPSHRSHGFLLADMADRRLFAVAVGHHDHFDRLTALNSAI